MESYVLPELRVAVSNGGARDAVFALPVQSEEGLCYVSQSGL